MTIWDAYQLANRRRCGLTVSLTEDSGLGNGRSERMLRVSPRRVNGHVAVQQGLTSDWIFLSPDHAKAVEVSR